MLQKALETYKEENGDKGISIGDLCALHGEYEILGMSFRKLNKLSQEERLKKYMRMFLVMRKLMRIM